MTVKVITDSTADLPADLARAMGITIVPVYVNLRGRSYRDGVDITLDEIYHTMLENDTPMTTSQPAPAEFAEAFRRVLKETDEVISINLTSRLSGLYQSAVRGKEMVAAKGKQIEVVDSASLTMGLGLITLAAARIANSGASLFKVLEETRQAIAHIRVWGIFDTLKYVLRSGRLGKAGNLLGSLLNVKPLLTVKEGTLHPLGLVRTRMKGIERLIENFTGCRDVAEVGIIHSTCHDEAQTLRARLSAVLDPKLIHVSRVGPALGLHAGPGTLGLAVRVHPRISNPIQ
jgi:DegV family protein with EDD domain